MRTASKNHRTIYYAGFSWGVEQKDADGFYTGETETFFETPKPYRLSVSHRTGETAQLPFGMYLDYDYAALAGKDCPIREGFRLWIEKEPYKDGTLTPHDYECVKVAPSLNFVTLAFKRVT